MVIFYFYSSFNLANFSFVCLFLWGFGQEKTINSDISSFYHLNVDHFVELFIGIWDYRNEFLITQNDVSLFHFIVLGEKAYHNNRAITYKNIFKSLTWKHCIFTSICWRIKSFHRLSTKFKQKYNVYHVNNLKITVQFTLK